MRSSEAAARRLGNCERRPFADHLPAAERLEIALLQAAEVRSREMNALIGQRVDRDRALGLLHGATIPAAFAFGIADAVAPYHFDSIYGAWTSLNMKGDGKAAFAASVERV